MDTLLDKILRAIRFQKVLPFIPKDCTILDIGSGDPPHLLLRIEGRIKQAFGIEKETEGGNITSKIKLIKNDLDKNPVLSFEDDFFDVIIMIAVIEHLEKANEILREIKRVLKDGGILILTTPTPSSKPILEFLAFSLRIISQKDISDHKHYFSKRELLKELEALHFKQVKHRYFQFGFNQILFAKKEP